MRIPLDSLDSTTWMAFSDWSAEQGKEKVAKYAGRVGKALEKFHKAGLEIKLDLVDQQGLFVVKESLELTLWGRLRTVIALSKYTKRMDYLIPIKCFWGGQAS